MTEKSRSAPASAISASVNDTRYSIRNAIVEERLRRIWTNAFAQSRLAWEEALRISAFARVPPSKREFFADCVCGIVREFWRLDGVPTMPGPALKKAAKAVRMLQEAQLEFDDADRALIWRILETKPMEFDEQFERLPQTTSQLVNIFNSAIGTTNCPDKGGPPRKRGRKKGSVSVYNRGLQKLVHELSLAALAAGGSLTFDKNFKKGSMIDALDALRKYLPAGVVPNVLPGTIQKFATGFNQKPVAVNGSLLDRKYKKFSNNWS